MVKWSREPGLWTKWFSLKMGHSFGQKRVDFEGGTKTCSVELLFLPTWGPVWPKTRRFIKKQQSLVPLNCFSPQSGAFMCSKNHRFIKGQQNLAPLNWSPPISGINSIKKPSFFVDGQQNFARRNFFPASLGIRLIKNSSTHREATKTRSIKLVPDGYIRRKFPS